jgi:ComF family protein
VAAVNYAYPWDGLVGGLKFHDEIGLADVFATLLADAVRRAGIPKASLVVPVPLGPRRLRERGYNQAWELGRRVARALDIEGNPRVLVRAVDTPQQAGLPRERRATNVRGAFRVLPAAAQNLRGRCVAVVDDVMTTGATAREAAQALLDAGAGAVQVWVAARTPAPAYA